jgi:hypothetical protein
LAGHRFTCRYCPNPQSIAESLVDVFGVETVVGLPHYTDHDWEALGLVQAAWAGRCFRAA